MTGDRGALSLPWADGIEPSSLLVSDFNELLLWAFDSGISDLSFGSDEPPIALIESEYVRIGHRVLTTQEINSIIATIYGEHGPARLAGSESLDFAYEVVRGRGERARFRVNATTGRTEQTAYGVELSLRTIPEVPPSMADLGIELEIIQAHREVAMTQGLVLTVGATGTGKSTLQASLMRDVLEQRPGRKLLTYEAPIEYVLSRVPNKVGMVVQAEVGRHVRSFADGVSNAMRRKPHVILIGEAREIETVTGVIEAALTGHAVYATMHAGSVASAVPRLVTMFPPSEHRSVTARLLDVLRLIVTQRLVPRVGGGRIALREYLKFDEDLRVELAFATVERLQGLIHTAVKEQGRSMLADAVEKNVAGLISDETLEIIRAEWESKRTTGQQKG